MPRHRRNDQRPLMMQGGVPVSLRIDRRARVEARRVAVSGERLSQAANRLQLIDVAALRVRVELARSHGSYADAAD